MISLFFTNTLSKVKSSVAHFISSCSIHSSAYFTVSCSHQATNILSPYIYLLPPMTFFAINLLDTFKHSSGHFRSILFWNLCFSGFFDTTLPWFTTCLTTLVGSFDLFFNSWSSLDVSLASSSFLSQFKLFMCHHIYSHGGNQHVHCPDTYISTSFSWALHPHPTHYNDVQSDAHM